MKKSWGVVLFVLLVACGSAVGGMLDDAGRALIDAGAALDSSADAQTAPGEWVDVVCDQEQVITVASDLETSVKVTRYAIVDVDPAAVQVESCTTQTNSYDADADGCNDTLADGYSCTSTGALPTSCSYSISASRLPDGQAYFWCGYTSDVTPTDPTEAPRHNAMDIRIRYRTVSLGL